MLVNVAVLISCKVGNETYILMEKDKESYNFPHAVVTESDTLVKVAQDVVFDHVGLSANWIDLQQVGIFDDLDHRCNGERLLTVVFFTIIEKKLEPRCNLSEWFNDNLTDIPQQIRDQILYTFQGVNFNYV